MTPEHPDLNPGDEAFPGTRNTGDDLCPECSGAGEVDGRQCDNCGGRGTVVVGIGGA